MTVIVPSVSKLNIEDYRYFRQWDRAALGPSFVPPLSSREKKNIVASSGGLSQGVVRNNPLASPGYVSFWQISKFLVDSYHDVDESQLPLDEMGGAFVDLLLDNWNGPADVGNCLAALIRIGSLQDQSEALFLWHGNCLRRFATISDEEHEEIESQLHSSDSNAQFHRIPFEVNQHMPNPQSNQAMPRMAISRDEALLETTYLSGRDRDFIVQKCGAGTVLVLRKFGVPEYETWFRSVVEPTVQKFGTCIQLDKELADWKSVAVDAIRRTDCVIIDLSFHLLERPSHNVLWELQELWKAISAYTREIVNGIPRDRVAFCCSGLDEIRPGEDWITIREISHEWLPLKSEGSPSHVFGPTIRKYRITTDRDKVCFTEWLESILSPWVQRVPPPLNLAALRQNLLTIKPADLARALWQHDLSYCADFMQRNSFSQEQINALAQTLTTVSVADVHRHTTYWQLVEQVFSVSPLLREHVYRLLRSEQLTLGHWVALSYRDSFWKMIERIVWKPSSSETILIMTIAENETDSEMRLVACGSAAKLLPHDRCKELQKAILMSMYGRPFPKLTDYVLR